MTLFNFNHKKQYLFLTNIIALIIFLSSGFIKNLSAKTYTSNTPANFLEVYTSQGCSSCPPAERWLSKFTTDKRLWKEIIPINFHVDYWDYLGWKDPFASAKFTQRQRRYYLLGKNPIVATPGFVVNGQGWSGWFKGRSVPTKKAKHIGTFSTEINNEQAAILFSPTQLISEPLVMHIAILGFDIVTHVKRGENHGKKLHHDFVVLGYKKTNALKKDNQFNAQTKLPEVNLPNINFANNTKQAIVTWVSSQRDPTPIHLVGGWL